MNVNFRNFIDNFTDIDDGLYVEDEESLSIVFNIISKGVVLRSRILERVTVVEFSPSSIGFLRSISILKG